MLHSDLEILPYGTRIDSPKGETSAGLPGVPVSPPSGPLPQPFPLGSRWGANGFPIPALSAARTWPYREIRNDIERLWHDAAMHKARVFLGLERKLLDLSLVILGIFWLF